jgi:hypothetical protein
MTVVSKPYTFSPNTVASSSQVNANFDTLYNDYNGGISAANIASSAITTAKIADDAITTAKLADSSVTYTELTAGMAVQTAFTVLSSASTGTTVIPGDNTIPQNTEGDQYMTLAITPKATTHTIVIEATLMLANSVANYLVAALFQDTTANAIATSAAYQTTANGLVCLKILHAMTAGTTSSTTFKVRAGGVSAGTTTFNGNAGGSLFGAITKSSMVITEYKA